MTIDLASKQDLEKLNAKLDNLAMLLQKLIADEKRCDTIDVNEVARMEGVSRSTAMKNQRWLLPNYGDSDYPDGKARWTLDTWLKWRAIPIEDRKVGYPRYLEEKRRRMSRLVEGS